MIEDKKDRIYSVLMDEVRDFSFDEKVVCVFEDMVHRSIPGYSTITAQTGAFAKRFVTENTNIYDLGCSLGAGVFTIRHCVSKPGCHIWAVDNSSAMLERFSLRLSRDVGVVPVTPCCADIGDVVIENASFVLMNFVLQFLEPMKKEKVLRGIFNGLKAGGALLCSEKICFEDEIMHKKIEELYFNFKQFNGYNDLEISQKRDALENVLFLNTEKEHLQRMEELGFSTAIKWYSNLNFASFLAIK